MAVVHWDFAAREIKMRIAFTAKMGSGKTTIVDKLVEKIGGKKFSIAANLKKHVIDYGFTSDNKIDKSRDRSMLQSYGQLRRDEVMRFPIYNGSVNNIFGTAYMLRNDEPEERLGKCYPDFWVDLLINEIDHIAPEYFFVDDVRRINEAARLRDNGFTIIRIDCPDEIRLPRLEKQYGKIPTELLNDISEREVPEIPVDYVVKNDGTLDEVIERALGII